MALPVHGDPAPRTEWTKEGKELQADPKYKDGLERKRLVLQDALVSVLAAAVVVNDIFPTAGEVYLA